LVSGVRSGPEIAMAKRWRTLSPSTTPAAAPPREELVMNACSTRRSTSAFAQHHASRYGLPAPSGTRPDPLSIRRLADAIDLQTQCKLAHRSVNGSDSIPLHRLFDEVDTAVAEYVQFLAAGAGQRIGAPDCAGHGGPDRAGLDSHTRGATPGDDQVAKLGTALSVFGARRA
jgi:hypothetical protein